MNSDVTAIANLVAIGLVAVGVTMATNFWLGIAAVGAVWMLSPYKYEA